MLMQFINSYSLGSIVTNHCYVFIEISLWIAQFILNNLISNVN